MPALFYPGQTDYIEKLNTLATTDSVTNGSLAASFLSLVVAGLSTFGGGLQVNAQASAPATPASGFTVFSDASHIPGWKGQNGYLVKLNATANTADRTYTLPNASGTFALLGSAQTFSAAQTVSINSASAALTLTQAGAGAALSTNGQIVSTLGTGTAPFSVVSTTVVANLNAALLNGATFAAPGTIGGGTPGAATFTALNAGVTRISAADGSSPIFGLSGTTKGIRFNFSASTSSIEGVDNTLVSSFQPLLLTASALSFYTTGTSPLLFGTNGATTQFAIANSTSAVNRYAAQGGTTGLPAFFYADGTDAAVSAGYSLKGAGNHVFYTGSTTVVQAYITHTASAANALTLTGSATGQPTRIGNFGSDTNSDILVAPQGTGIVRLGGDSIRIMSSKTPASASATGSQGQIAWDASYIYVCTAANTWKRAAIATW